tara:strand:- start:321 stop:581 length:261 start_codon:yes stop_codon:yes gene_type:complete
MNEDTLAILAKKIHRLAMERCVKILESDEPLSAQMLKEVRGLLKDNGVDDPMMEQLIAGPVREFKPMPFQNSDDHPMQEDDLKNLG